jgi:hypothetical protein
MLLLLFWFATPCALICRCLYFLVFLIIHLFIILFFLIYSFTYPLSPHVSSVSSSIISFSSVLRVLVFLFPCPNPRAWLFWSSSCDSHYPFIYYPLFPHIFLYISSPFSCFFRFFLNPQFFFRPPCSSFSFSVP